VLGGGVFSNPDGNVVLASSSERLSGGDFAEARKCNVAAASSSTIAALQIYNNRPTVDVTTTPVSTRIVSVVVLMV
jgi:hypothetical protein